MVLKPRQAPIAKFLWLPVAGLLAVALHFVEELADVPLPSCGEYSAHQTVEGGLTRQEFIVVNVTPERGRLRVFYTATGVEAIMECSP